MSPQSYKSYMDALSKISKAITSDIYLDDILKLIVSLTANVIKAKICALWLYDEKTQGLKIRATQSISKEYLADRSIKYGEGVIGLVAKSQKPISIKDVKMDARYKEKHLAQKEGLASMLSVPMMVKNRLIGVLSCYTTTEYEFTKSDIDLVTTIANQAAVAIENTELMVRTKVVQEELESRKRIEKAKGILMKEQGLTEDEAYSLIRRSSMDKRVHMKDIAEAIILSHEVRRR